jgi:hypothetical protein
LVLSWRSVGEEAVDELAVPSLVGTVRPRVDRCRRGTIRVLLDEDLSTSRREEVGERTEVGDRSQDAAGQASGG